MPAETLPRLEVLVLLKGLERYVFRYRAGDEAALLRSFGKLAANPELSFGWYDAAMLCVKIRRNDG